MPVKISYVSEANNQVLVYFDKRFVGDIENKLKKAKDLASMEETFYSKKKY